MSSTQSKSFYSSFAFHGLLVVLLLLFFFALHSLLSDIFKERDSNYKKVINDMAQDWGGDQTVVGPVLVVPYVEHVTSVETVTDNNGDAKTVSRDIFTKQMMILLPEELRITAKLNEAHRKKGHYDSLVYQADLSMTGFFNLDLLPHESNKYTIRWKKAWLAVGLSDTKVISSTSPLRWDDNSAKFEPGTQLDKLLPNGIHAKMTTTSNKNKRPEFKIQLSFKGSNAFRFAPLGESTVASISSAWSHPSFQGSIIPKSKIISDEGFSAEWNIPHLSRNYPQSWLQGEQDYSLSDLVTGVDIKSPASVYSKISQVVKYGALFIAMAFLALMVFDTSSATRVHLIQYGIVGLSLSLFYFLLAVLTEYFPFKMAYLYAVSGILGTTTVYAMVVLKSFSKGFFILLILGSLYAALYLIMQKEDYALIASSAALLFSVVLFMIATRKIQ